MNRSKPDRKGGGVRGHFEEKTIEFEVPLDKEPAASASLKRTIIPEQKLEIDYPPELDRKEEEPLTFWENVKRKLGF